MIMWCGRVDAGQDEGSGDDLADLPGAGDQLDHANDLGRRLGMDGNIG